MIGPHHSFARLVALRGEPPDGIAWPLVHPGPVPSPDAIDRRAREVAEALGWRMQQGEPLGEYLVVPSECGQLQLQLNRFIAYVFAEPHEVLEAAEALVRHVRSLLHAGAGRVWALDELVHIVLRDGELVAEDVNGKHYLRMRTIVSHDPGTLAWTKPLRMETRAEGTQRVLEQLVSDDSEGNDITPTPPEAS